MRGKEFWRMLSDASWLLSQARDVFLDTWDSVSQQPFAQLYRIIRPYTVCGNTRLRGLYWAVEHVVAEDVPGDLVECGTARGGSFALMGLAMKQLGVARTLWAFDTFEGLPPPTDADPDQAVARFSTGGFRGDLCEVMGFLDRLGILSQCRLVKGPFQDTLPRCEVERIAVLHIDCDWYESVKACLHYLYDRVSPGGVVQIDDYGHWAGARKAVHEFLRQRSVQAPLRRLDYTGRQLIKP